MGFFSFLSGDKRSKEQIEAQEKYKSELKQYINENYGAPKIHGSANYDVYINMQFRKIATCYVEYTFKDYSFDIIRGAYITIDDEVITKTQSGIGRAIIGGMIAGSMGAAVGYLSRKSEQKTLINNARLTIITSDPNMPEIYIPLLGKAKKNYANDSDVKRILNSAESLIHIIDQISMGVY